MSDRPSRQESIVPQKHSNLVFGLSAVACACAGFGLVWACGVGRTRSPFPPEPVTAAIAGAMTGAGDDAGPPAADPAPRRFAPVTGDTDQPAGSGSPLTHTARFPTGDDAVPREPVAAGTRFSRFSSSAVPPRSQPAAFAPLESAPATPTAPPMIADTAATELPLAAESIVASEAGEQPDLSASPARESQFLTAQPAEEQGEPAADQTTPVAFSEELPEDVGDLAASPTHSIPPTDSPLPPGPIAAESASSESAAASPQARHTEPETAVAVAAPPPFLAVDKAISPETPILPPARAGQPPEQTTSGTTPATIANPFRGAAATLPFAAAPPLTTAPAASPTAQPLAGMPPGALLSAPPGAGSPSPAINPVTQPLTGSDTQGQGRPGPLPLEGLQSPQIAVEKRGPREVQVGKAARFEILVRNVGSAMAHDVVLRDAVPYGTQLIATTPPASPGAGVGGRGTGGELVWLIGSLAPGAQSRVSVDVMPTAEGEVGSVASVSFRAEASLRARATKPALAITFPPPPPTLVGRDVRIPITVTNPGTGVATGVVLEGVLPEGISHRAGRELEFDIGQLPPGESRTIDMALASTSPGSHSLRLTARADGQIETEEMVRIAITAPTLELTAAIPSRRYLQRPATCVLSMTNAGTAPAKTVELAAQLPPGMKFIRANNAGYYEERTHRVLWTLEELPAAETGEVEVVMMPIQLGPQKIMAAARSADGLADQVTHTVEVEGLAAVSFEVTDSEDPIEVSGMTEYLIRVGNQGTKPASGVRVVATLLGDLEPLEAKGPTAHSIENLTVLFEPLAKLAPAEEALFRIRVRGRREGDQRVQVQLTSDDQPAPITKEEITRVYADR